MVIDKLLFLFSSTQFIAGFQIMNKLKNLLQKLSEQRKVLISIMNIFLKKYLIKSIYIRIYAVQGSCIENIIGKEGAI